MIDVDAEFFEMISQINMIAEDKFSVSIKARCGLMEGHSRYFFVRISSSSISDPSGGL